jgi:hypothetical protein
MPVAEAKTKANACGISSVAPNEDDAEIGIWSSAVKQGIASIQTIATPHHERSTRNRSHKNCQ